MPDYAVHRMMERDISPEDLDSALCKASMCRLQKHGRWLVVGPDVSGDELQVVVEIQETVVVVTLFRGEEE